MAWYEIVRACCFSSVLMRRRCLKKVAFFSRLSNEPQSDEDYKRVWRKHYDIKKTSGNITISTSRQTFCFLRTFSKVSTRHVKRTRTELFAHSITTEPQFAYVASVELDLITDLDIYFMIESGIRGGVSQRYARVNAPTLPNYCPYCHWWLCCQFAVDCYKIKRAVYFLFDTQSRT